jgi:hypothetical protein
VRRLRWLHRDQRRNVDTPYPPSMRVRLPGRAAVRAGSAASGSRTVEDPAYGPMGSDESPGEGGRVLEGILTGPEVPDSSARPTPNHVEGVRQG